MTNLFQEHMDPEFFLIINSFKLRVMMSDFWRYFVLYIKGGIYADTDVRLLKPIEDWEFDPLNNW